MPSADFEQRIFRELATLQAQLAPLSAERFTRLQAVVETLAASAKDQEERLRAIEQRDAILEVMASQAAIRAQDIATLKASQTAMEERHRELEKAQAQAAVKWTILGLIGAAVVSVLIGAAFSSVKASQSGTHAQQYPPPIVQRQKDLDAERLRDGR